MILPRGLSCDRLIRSPNLSSFTVILTDRCNYHCAYCYQPKGKQFLRFSAFAKAIDFFYPFFASECVVEFYGGEPLLAFDELKRTVEYAERVDKKNIRKIRYSLTTNGSLLSDSVLGFLDEHRFSVILSFDGLAQDLSRRKGSFAHLASTIPKILARPRISLETNSVFSPETIGYLASSVKSIIRMGVRKINVNFAHKPLWTPSTLLRLEEEITYVGAYFESHYERPQDVPWTDLYEEPEKAVHGCPAGRDQMALSAQGTLWGCALFPHYFMSKEGAREDNRYCFGDVDSFLRSPQRLYARTIVDYSGLRMDAFSTPSQSCLMCSEIEQCSICPIAAALTTDKIGQIPAWRCQQERTLRKVRRRLLNRFRKKMRETGQASVSDGRRPRSPARA